MIFLSEQPQTGMNEGTWFTQGMCIKNEGIFVGRKGIEGEKKKKSLPEKLRQGFIIVIKVILRS